MAEQKEHVGMNKTGIQMSPLETKHMLDDDKILSRGDAGDETASARLRQSYIGASNGLGSIPVPGTMKGMVSMGVHMIKGEQPQVLLDKLAERMAFERTGSRLYEGLLVKLDAMSGTGAAADLSIDRGQVLAIRDDEVRHMLLVKEAIESLGGDPTAMTPSADAVGVQAMGFIQLINDPRASLAQTLCAILSIELTDNAGWETLIALADDHGQTDMVNAFSHALEHENKHLAMVQGWYQETLGLDAAAPGRTGVIGAAGAISLNAARTTGGFGGPETLG